MGATPWGYTLDKRISVGTSPVPPTTPLQSLGLTPLRLALLRTLLHNIIHKPRRVGVLSQGRVLQLLALVCHTGAVHLRTFPVYPAAYAERQCHGAIVLRRPVRFDIHALAR